MTAAVAAVLNTYAVSDPPEHVIVNGDNDTDTEFVYALVHVGAVPVIDGVTSGPLAEPE